MSSGSKCRSTNYVPLVDLVEAGHVALSWNSHSQRPLPDKSDREDSSPISKAKADRLATNAEIIIATHHRQGTHPSETERKPGEHRSDSNARLADRRIAEQRIPDERITYQRLHARAPSTSQRRALAQRDQGRRFPGCSVKGSLHAHHIHEHAKGGTTTTHNLILLCSMHHHAIHRNDWTITGNPNGPLTFTRPGLTTARPQTGDSNNLKNNPQDGRAAGPIRPLGNGEPFDLHLAVQAHHHNKTLVGQADQHQPIHRQPKSPDPNRPVRRHPNRTEDTA